MNPEDLIRAAPEIAKGAGALAAAIPFTAVVKRMLGPAADEMWRDQIRVYRYGRQLKLLEKAERMAREAGFTPQAVPPKILFPLLEGASFEEDENLHDMWAALLANAASPENGEKVRPGFIAILKQMAPDEAKLLRWLSEAPEDQSLTVSGLSRKIWHVDRLLQDYGKTLANSASVILIEMSFDALEAGQVLRRFSPPGWQLDICMMSPALVISSFKPAAHPNPNPNARHPHHHHQPHQSSAKSLDSSHTGQTHRSPASERWMYMACVS
jgi:hypothetical protein